MPDPTWVFDPVPPSGSRKGGLASAHVFDPNLDSFVREVLQNSRDQRLPGGCARVRFCLQDVQGDALDHLLERIGWTVLADHIQAAAAKGNATLSPRLKEGLAAVARGRLRVLLVEDLDTNGLTGDEFAEGGNFANLTRHELVTPDRENSGGSFGLGKSVLWRFSMLSTVLFNSVPREEPSPRFIGRALLSGHETGTDYEWDGPGWFGARDVHPAKGARAVSMRGDAANAAVAGTLLERDPVRTGASALVLAFDDPAQDPEPSVAESCDAIVRSATKWFWPALQRGDLSVSVEGWEGDTQVFGPTEAPSVDEAVKPFVDAVVLSPGPADPAGPRPAIYDWELGVDVPAMRTDGSVVNPRPAAHAVVNLRASVGGDSADALLDNTVALTRGSGMVIAYHSLHLRQGIEEAVHAVLQAGEAHGDSESDKAIERFLRAAEPPAHERWTHMTDRVRAEYSPNTKVRAAIDAVIGGIDRQLRELVPQAPDDSDDGPDAFKRLFPLLSGGETEHTEQFFLREPAARLDGGRWYFSGEFVRKPRTQREVGKAWAFRVSLAVSGDGKREVVPLELLEAHPPGVSRTGDASVVDVPADTESVAFSGRTAPLQDIGVVPGEERRVRGKLIVQRVDPA